MAGPIPLLGLLDELRDFANRRNMANKLVGGGIKGAAIRGLLGMDAPDNATKAEREVYENAARAAAPVMGLAAAPAAIKTAGRALKDAPRAQALEAARQNAVKMLGLPENNTAMDRARAMGFEEGWAHGSPRNDIVALQSSKTGAEGPGAYATNYLPEASTYSQSAPGATVYPLLVRRAEAMSTGPNNPYEVLKANTDEELMSELFKRGKSAIVKDQEKTPDWLLRAGGLDMPERQHFVSTKPSNFRSRFAAFDPARMNENDLLASLAAAGVSIPMILGLLDEERVD